MISSKWVVILGLFNLISFSALANDRPANGGFSFMNEGSIVVEFYRDSNPPTVHADKYVVFKLKDGAFSKVAGEVYTADAKKCASSDCWVRQELVRRKEFPSLKTFLQQKYGSEAEMRWQAFRADSAILNKESADALVSAKDRIYFSRQSRARLPFLMDPAPGVSYTVYLLEDCPAPVWGMLREIYDIDGGLSTHGAALVTERTRMLTNTSGHNSSNYGIAIKRVTLLVRDYLNHYFAHKKN